MPPIYVHVPRRANWPLRIFLTLLILGFIVFIAIIAAVGAGLSSAQTDHFSPRTIEEGDKSQVVAVYDVTDMIDSHQADRFRHFARHHKERFRRQSRGSAHRQRRGQRLGQR